jgi:hypothetical protein
LILILDQLGGNREKLPPSNERSCPPGHRFDGIIGCIAIDAVAAVR